MTPDPVGYPKQSALAALQLGIKRKTAHWSYILDHKPRKPRTPKLTKLQRKIDAYLESL